MSLPPLQAKRRLSGSSKSNGLDPPERSRNVFLQGLPVQWNTDKLRFFCGKFGKVELAKVVRDSTTSMSCGHGFVLFETEEQALNCVTNLNGFVVDGHTLTCRLAREKLNLSTIAAASKALPPMLPMQLLHLSANGLEGSETNTTPRMDFTPPLGVMHTVPSSLPANLVSLVNCGNWPAVGVVPACPGGNTLGSAVQYAQQTCAPVSTTPGIIQSLLPQPQQFFAVSEMKCQIERPQMIGNTYLFAVPIAHSRTTQTFNTTTTPVGVESPFCGLMEPLDGFSF